MKRTQRKDGLRNIKKQWVSFCSIVLITIMGVTAFLGIDYTAVGLRKNASEHYNELNFRDIEVVSTLLFSEEDLKNIQKVKGVADAEPIRSIGAVASAHGYTCDVSVHSLTKRINKIDLVEGRLPSGRSECLIEETLATDYGLSVGDRLKLTDAAGNRPEYLREKEFLITGIANHPDHANVLVIDSPYVLVEWDAFDSEALDNCFMQTEIVIEKPVDVDRFSDAYDAAVKEVLDRIDTLALSATKMRDKTIVDAATDLIESAKEQVEDGFDQLETAKATLRDKIRGEYERIFREDADRQLLFWAEPRKADADDPNETAMYFWITENVRLDLKRPLEEILEAITYSKSISDNFLVVLYEITQEKDAPKIGDAYDMETIRQTLVQSSAKTGEAYTQLAEACAMWDDGHAQYLEGKAQYDKAMAELQPCRWLSYGVKGNASFVQLIVGSGSFGKLKSTFSLFFVAVGALVIFATVGKMVDEQRSLIGTTKALGFFNREVFVKYLGFGVSATLMGTLLGILTARFLIAPFLISGFNQYYIFDITPPRLTLLNTILVVIAGILLATLSIWFGCSKLLREPATRLMQSKAPSLKKAPKKAKRLRSLSLYSKLILLNMRMDLKRVVVTIVSVAGCCALIVIGFTLRSSLQGSVTKQYSEIVHYDLCVLYNLETSEAARSDTEAVLKSAGTQYAGAFRATMTYNIEDLQVGELYCGDLDEIHEFMRLNDWKTGEPLHSNANGVYIQRRMAEVYSLDVGSEFEVALGGVQTATVRVAGVFENYIGRTMFMSREYYEHVFGKAPIENAFLVSLDGAAEEELIGKLTKVSGFGGYLLADSDRSLIEDSTAMINTLVLLFIFIAAVMAGVVQMNLTNMYVLQKKRELTIMRVNGFSTKEVINYMLRETVFTTIFGILFGILIGTGLAYRIVRTIEQSFLQVDRSPNYWAWLIAALMTLLFTVIVNAIALKKVKYLKLTDVA